MRKLFVATLAICFTGALLAQSTVTKYFAKNTKAGQVYNLYTYGQFVSGNSQRIYVIDAPAEKSYYISFMGDLRTGEKIYMYVDQVFTETMYAGNGGWQWVFGTKGTLLTAGKHEIRFETSNTPGVPVIEELLVQTTALGRDATNVPGADFLAACNRMQQQRVVATPTVAEAGDLTTKVLPNPEGLYDHAIDTSFAYSHFSWVYLTAGNHQFRTASSTVSRALTVFNPNNFILSWSNVNGGVNGESQLDLIVSTAGYYAVMVRPYPSGSGLTDIYLDNTLLVDNAVVNGRTYTMSALKGGDLNFFTCRLTQGDTRMIASRYFASSARGYNDDYTTAGDWNWGYASRIKKSFGTDSVQYGYVCAYSPLSTGISDVYLGNENSNVNYTNYPEFPLLKPDDAIKTASNTGMYNCISWSGGITSTWVWPPSWYSTYNCPANDMNLTCFDNFYSNNPVRYPGAWNYTRTGATSANAVVDLWALNGHFTHASVRKPGNNHPHGYDWESKPGGTTRTLHPRNALTNLGWGYGAVVNYYIPTGTYARNATLNFETDADAVRAGVAVFDVARLSETADQKLTTLLRKTEAGFTARFNELYAAWKKTWEQNAIYSDPAAYCKNEEYKALEAYALKNPKQAMLRVFEKFVTGNEHLSGELLLTLTKEKYGYLMDQVKAERQAKPNDAQGRYRIHGDHDNGVLYVEKILAVLDYQPDPVVITDAVNIVVSPNPVKDRLVVNLTLQQNSRVSITVLSSQTGIRRVVQPEKELLQGTHRLETSIQGIAGSTGDMLAVQVVVDGVVKTVKVLVAK